MSDAINQIKDPSALLKEFLGSTHDSREGQTKHEMSSSKKKEKKDSALQLFAATATTRAAWL